METKFKIVLVLFVVVLLAYAIYYVMSDMNKQKASEQKDKRILETFEEYDIRKQLLTQLDKFKIDPKVKAKVFDSLSKKVDNYRNMSPEDLKDMINAGIKDLEKRYGVIKSSGAKPKEKYVEDEADTDAEADDADAETEAYEDEEQAKLDSLSRAIKRTRESFAKEDTFDQPAPIKRSPPKEYDNDIANILDNTSSSLETVQRNLTKLKNILTDSKPSAKGGSKTIEGFENRSNSYASYF